MLAESLILVEFVADLFPQSSLLPADPVLRARARFFVDQCTQISTNFLGIIPRGEMDGLFPGIRALQQLLPAEGNGPYIIGDTFTIADIAIAPLVGLLSVALENDVGAFAEGEGRKAFNTIQTDAQYASFKRYVEAIQDRESFKTTCKPVRCHVYFVLICSGTT